MFIAMMSAQVAATAINKGRVGILTMTFSAMAMITVRVGR